MEVSGQHASTSGSDQVVLGSDEGAVENPCAQCAENDLNIEASGYCVDCTDYLCSSCIQQHKHLRGLKRHSVLSGADMPLRRPSASGTDRCPEHPAKPIELYCQTDDTLGCVLCFTVKHRSCEHFGLISDMSKGIDISTELKNIQRVSKQHIQTIRLYKHYIQECHKNNEGSYNKSVDDFQTFRSELLAVLDRLAERVHSEARDLKQRNTEKLDRLLESVLAIEEEIEAIVSDIEVKQKADQKDLLFISVKRNLKQIEDEAKKLDQLKTEIKVTKYRFAPDATVRQLLDKEANIGEVTEFVGDIACTAELNAGTTEDKGECGVCAIEELPPSHIVVTDYNNQCLKQIDVDTDVIVTRRSLGTGPRDVRIIPDSRLAVVLPDLHEIRYFTTDKDLTPCGGISVAGQCMAVDCTGDKLVVSFREPGMVQIINLDGTVIMTLEHDPAANILFGVPRYLRLNTDGTAIYISDWKVNAITCMTMAGDVMWVYKDPNLKYPQGMTTGSDGSLLICDRYSHNVHVVTPTGELLNLLSTKKFGLNYPAGICYRKECDGLFLSSWSAEPKDCNLIRKTVLL